MEKHKKKWVNILYRYEHMWYQLRPIISKMDITSLYNLVSLYKKVFNNAKKYKFGMKEFFIGKEDNLFKGCIQIRKTTKKEKKEKEFEEVMIKLYKFVGYNFDKLIKKISKLK